jgi:tetratricopeptide (TPR) repeat protein
VVLALVLCGAGARAESPVLAGGGSTVNGDADTSEAPRELAAWLERLLASDAAVRASAVLAIDQAAPTMLPAIADRLARLGPTADRTGMAAVVAEIVKPRPVDRDEIAGRLPDGGFSPSDDWLTLLMNSASPDRAPWRELTSIVGLSRMLARIATTPAVRELSALFTNYGELLRPDLERQLLLIGDRALPGLIEMRRAEAKETRIWALKLLEALGKAIPGEAVQTGDDQLLAEVLLAYGRARELDALRVVLSFANSDRRQIREAARRSLMMFGESGRFALRESYENMMSKKAADDWGWETTARELFAAFDRARLAEAYALMDEGLAAFQKDDSERAAVAFDRVLARDPAFERRAEMAPAYLAFARTLKNRDRGQALAALRKAMRVDPTGQSAREAESELLVLETKTRADHGVVDEAALRRALELDPRNAEAKDALVRLETESRDRSGRLLWYLGAAMAALFAVGGAAAAFAHGRRSAG